MPAQSTRANDRASRNALLRPYLLALMCGLVVAALFVSCPSSLDALRLRIRLPLWRHYRGIAYLSLRAEPFEILSVRLKSIKLMDHQVRNALNVITLSVSKHGHVEVLSEIQSSVNRIDWALREILPGRVLDDNDYDGTAAEQEQEQEQERVA